MNVLVKSLVSRVRVNSSINQYGSLFSTGLLFTPKEPLNTIVAIQFVPLLATFGAIAAITYRRTNSATSPAP